MIVFDLDGTLFDTASAFIPACKDFFREYQKTYPGDSEVMKLVGEPESYFRDWLIQQGIKAKFEDVRSKMIELEVQHIYATGKLFEGIYELLQNLKTIGQTLALCSNAVPAYQQAVFKKTNIEVFFNRIRLPESSADTKISMVRELIQITQDPYPHIMIGDRIHDIEAGKANGIVTIGCAYGYGMDEIKEADYKVQSASELNDIIQQILNAE